MMVRTQIFRSSRVWFLVHPNFPTGPSIAQLRTRNNYILQINRHHSMKRIQLSIALTLLLLICSACSAGTATNPAARLTPTHRSTQPAQPITGSQLLSRGAITYVALGASDAVGVGSNKPGS